MSSFKGTPGPWLIDANDVGSRWNVDAENGESVALSHQVSNDKEWMKRDANTRLIAAAPELLEALQWAMARIGSYTQRTRSNQDYCDQVDKANAAIAKALGQ